MKQTLDQIRAVWAYQVVEAFLGQSPTQERKRSWKTAVMDFGTQVQRCGLLQALAFLKRDACADVHRELLPRVQDHLAKKGMLPARDGARPDFFVEVRGLSAANYMLVTRETMNLAIWLRRATQALCGEA